MKILIFGSTGWFGRATLDYFIRKFNNQCNFTLISSSRKSFEFKGYKFNTENLDYLNSLRDLTFDYYFDFAFLTGKNVTDLSNRVYASKTNKLINSSNNFLKNNYVDKALLTSSGAVYWKGTSKETIYTLQKIKQEKEFMKTCEDNNVNYSIARVFAVIARHYNYNFNYAFSSFVQQSITKKEIRINSDKKVIRAYLIFDNLIDYFIENDKNNKLYDAWNVKLDIYELANIISKVNNCSIVMENDYLNAYKKDEYISTDFSFKNYFQDEINLQKTISDYINYTESINNKFIFNN
tara:strand:+ start:80 stop:961 length:882 start_codon:yes stop_codon:yes gene_type:complete